ncbi:MAG: hypothetical protein KQH63_17240 [Desulfobulbaceae bacterium]|nr:hypothetical protein [Desulfobulbaceae bacterium]
MKVVKKKLKQEVLVGCLDVLCRASANAVENDPHLAADILDAIESLTLALQGETQAEQPVDIEKKDNGQKYVSLYEDNIVDVLTNEVIYRPSESQEDED